MRPKLMYTDCIIYATFKSHMYRTNFLLEYYVRACNSSGRIGVVVF